MARVRFYEKPGCINNTRQKGMLQALGHDLDVRDLLTTPWTAESLRPFFGDLAVAEWFNASAPRIKSGEVDPAVVDEASALSLMVADPLLIRRPLIEVSGERMCGFDPCPMLRGLGLVFDSDQDLQSCPRTHSETSCSAPDAVSGN